MPIINLIQEQRVADQKRDQRLRIAMFTFFGTISFGVLGYGILMFEQQGYRAEISRLTTEIESNKPVMTQIDNCKKLEAGLQPRLTTLTEAQRVTGKWADILKHLETQTPGDAWLTGLQCPNVPGDKPISLIFTGTARAQQPISEFILRTQNDQVLTNVNLHFTAEKHSTLGIAKAVDFELGAEIVDSADEKKSVKEDVKS